MNGPAGDRARRRRETQEEVWSSLGGSDPDWGVLTIRTKRHGGWDSELEQFYRSGQAEVGDCLALASPASTRRALDYGAGTGRLSFALAEVFDEVTSVDVSPGMLTLLAERASARGLGNVAPIQPEDLGSAGLHDFALSLLVLQHLPSVDAIAEAIGMIAGRLRPGAAAVIELPETIKTVSARVQPRWHAYRILRRLGVPPARLHRLGLSGISMVAVPRTTAEAIFEKQTLDVINRVVRPDSDYDYVRWVVVRRSPP
jgi:2-polyprenyl-3-methyl-5-hydroxy-6-metoxy-1,4-benzoquinol methylase